MCIMTGRQVIDGLGCTSDAAQKNKKNSDLDIDIIYSSRPLHIRLIQQYNNTVSDEEFQCIIRNTSIIIVNNMCITFIIIISD